jgi:hypothetical protein
MLHASMLATSFALHEGMRETVFTGDHGHDSHAKRIRVKGQSVL